MFVSGSSTPNRYFTIAKKYHFPKRKGDVSAVDIYGSLQAYLYLREMFGVSLCVVMCFQNLLNYVL
jgi:hypothetical protein